MGGKVFRSMAILLISLFIALAAGCQQSEQPPAPPATTTPPAATSEPALTQTPAQTPIRTPPPRIPTRTPESTTEQTPTQTPEPTTEQTPTQTPEPAPIPRGTVDPSIHIDIYESDKAWPGTTLFSDIHNSEVRRILEVNMLGEVIWEYVVPENLMRYTAGGFDVEWLPNNNILFVLPRNGVYEINRNGEIVWSYLTEKISHDADRLPNGNTIFVWGFPDEIDDAQVVEVNPEGEIIWEWYAKDHFHESPYIDIYADGWTHTNAVTRLPNGNTLISPRNFQFVIEVDPQGAVVKTVGEGIVHDPHDPEVLANGNILVCSFRPHRAVEIVPETNRVVWEYVTMKPYLWGARDADRLPNGNTLLCGTGQIAEVNTEGNIVWQLRLSDVSDEEQAAATGFYKAERIELQEEN